MYAILLAAAIECSVQAVAGIGPEKHDSVSRQRRGHFARRRMTRGTGNEDMSRPSYQSDDTEDDAEPSPEAYDQIRPRQMLEKAKKAFYGMTDDERSRLINFVLAKRMGKELSDDERKLLIAKLLNKRPGDNLSEYEEGIIKKAFRRRIRNERRDGTHGPRPENDPESDPESTPESVPTDKPRGMRRRKTGNNSERGTSKKEKPSHRGEVDDPDFSPKSTPEDTEDVMKEKMEKHEKREKDQLDEGEKPRRVGERGRKNHPLRGDKDKTDDNEPESTPEAEVVQTPEATPEPEKELVEDEEPGSPTAALKADTTEQAACFPADATVELEDGTVKRMDEIVIGDVVRVGKNDFSKVFMFTHKLHEGIHPFLRIQTEAGYVLSGVTTGHYIYASGALVAAKSVQVGDVIELANGDMTAVTSIQHVTGRGLYNPQTVHGDIYVDNVRSSTYTMAVEPALAHVILAPLRAIFELLGATLSVFDNGAPALVDFIPGGGHHDL